jgi:urea transport system permease protein
MRCVLVALFLAWLAAPAAGQAAPLSAADADRALADLAGEDGDRREAAVKTLGGTADPKWLEFLAAFRDGNVYARMKGATPEVLVGGAKTARGDQDVIELRAPYSGAARGTAPLSSLKEVAADRKLRLVIKPFVDADETKMQLADPDANVRRGAAVKLGNLADVRSAGVIDEALARESDRWVRDALAEARALIRLGGSDPGLQTGAARALGDLHSTTALPALRALAADASVPAPLRSEAAHAVR